MSAAGQAHAPTNIVSLAAPGANSRASMHSAVPLGSLPKKRMKGRQPAYQPHCDTASQEMQLRCEGNRAQACRSWTISPDQHEVAAACAAGLRVEHALAQSSGDGGIRRIAALLQHRGTCRHVGRQAGAKSAAGHEPPHFACGSAASNMPLAQPAATAFPSPASPMSLQRPWSAATRPPAAVTLRGRPR